MISDLVLSLFAFFFFFQHRLANKKWSLFFLFMGFSSFVGAMYHGFFETYELLRFLSWALFSAALIFAQLAAYQHDKNNFIKTTFVLKSIVLLFLSIQNTSFSFMVVDTILSMFGFIVIGNLLYLKSLSKTISYGIIISFLSVFVVVFHVSIHPEYITQNDIGHYISIVSLAVMSKGVREDVLEGQLKVKVL